MSATAGVVRENSLQKVKHTAEIRVFFFLTHQKGDPKRKCRPHQISSQKEREPSVVSLFPPPGEREDLHNLCQKPTNKRPMEGASFPTPAWRT